MKATADFTNRAPRLREYSLTLAAASLFYLATMAPGALWGDSGLAQCRVLQRDIYGTLGLALSHPLYYVIGFAAQDIPIGSPAWRVNLVSALFAAMTVANVFWLLRWMVGGRIAPLCAAISLAVAHTFWQHAALAEVYSLSTALLTFELLFLWLFAKTGRGAWIVLAALANGLGVSNHLVAVLGLPCYVAALIYLTSQRQIGLRTWLLSLSAWLLGAGLYIGMVVGELRSGHGLSETLNSALFGNRYAGAALNVNFTAKLLLNSVLYIGLNFPSPIAAFAVIGFWRLRRFAPRWYAAVFAGLFAIHFLWAARYNVPDQYTFFIPTVVLISVLIGLGIAVLGRRAAPAAEIRERGFPAPPTPAPVDATPRRATQTTSDPRDVPMQWWIPLLACSLLPVAVYVPLPQIAQSAGLNLEARRQVPFRDTYSYFFHPWKTGEDSPARFVADIKAALKPGDILLADGTTVRPLHYAILIGDWPDEIHVFPKVGAADEDWPSADELAREIDAGRVYIVSPIEKYCPRWLLHGFTFKQDAQHPSVFAVQRAPSP